MNTLLIILDGWGHGAPSKGNAIFHARKPIFDKLMKLCPNTTLEASGQFVGLPDGQIGSSEVGHTIIGAGRNVPQLSTMITQAARSGTLNKNPVLSAAAKHALNNNSVLHLIGLASDGGVHSFWEHLTGLLRLAKYHGLTGRRVAVHVLLDGRDVAPMTGKGYIERLEREMLEIGSGHIATVGGRYWLMDRDKRWDRVAKAYQAIAHGQGPKTSNPAQSVADSYRAGVTDEFIEPMLVTNESHTPTLLRDGDSVILYNFRADRMRQIARVLSDPSFSEFDRNPWPKLHVACMTPYDVTLQLPSAFSPETVDPGRERSLGLPQLVSERGWPQLRIAETEKYAHVTYFLSGGAEKPLNKENRLLVASPKVSTYDLAPRMSAQEITDQLLKNLDSYPLAVCNFANADMVGHSGIFPAAVEACEFVDQCLGRILEAKERVGGALIITADHGNSECVTNEDGTAHTAHTINPVPFILWTKEGLNRIKLRSDADRGLKDIAPTILELMNVPQPSSMSGRSLLLK